MQTQFQENMPIQVAIADSQYLIRVGLRHLLEADEGISIVGEASDKEQLFQLLEIEKPAVLIFDYNHPAIFSQDDIMRIKSVSPDTGILIISADNDRQNIYKVLEMGVNSFLTKECDKDEIFQAVRATAAREKFFCHKVLEFLLEKSFGSEGDCLPTPLTPREVEIVRWVAEGKTAKDISDLINISVHTIYTHRKNIMKKLKLSSTSELVLYAVRQGIVDSSLPQN